MGVFKEEANIFETIEKKQSRIFKDAADYGVAYNSNAIPKEVADVFQALAHLKKLDASFPEEKYLIRNRQTWGSHDNKGPSGVSVEVVFFWERDMGYDIGTKYSISFQKLTSSESLIIEDANAVIAIDSEPYKERT